jgi:hypothetical protein
VRVKFQIFLVSLIVLVAGSIGVFPTQPAKAANDVSLSCAVGSSSSCPAQSPQEIINLYGTSTNGTYWLNVNGTARETYVILSSGYPDSGGWFLGMKGTRSGTSFTYNSTQWTDQTTTLSPSSLLDDVSTEAKFHAFNHLPVTKLVAVFKDRASNAFNTNGSGDLGTNSFGGHTWMETITASTMFSRFTSQLNLVDASGYSGRFTLTRETNSSSGKLVLPYQTGWSRYGFNNTDAYVYRWGLTFNNEGSYGSNDTGSGIGMSTYSAAAQVSYSDNLTVGPNSGSGASNPGTFAYPSGFQIWGKMAAGTLAAPTSITQSQQSSSSTRISWASVASANEYLVQYKTSAQSWSQGSTVRVTSPSASPSALLTGLTDTSYNVRIWARGSSNTYGASSGSLNATLDQTAPTITGPSSATGANSSISIAESSTAVHTFTANESVTWSKSGTDESFFSITSAGGVLTITARDFESPVDNGSNNTYVATITATDTAGNATNQTLTVTITNVNEAPTITTASSAATHTISQAENNTSVVTHIGSDFDAGTTLTWSMSGTDAADFSINSSSGALAFVTNPDFEAPADADTNNAYVVVVTLSDGSLTDTQTVTITITNANESASINAPTVLGTINKGVNTTITVTINVAGKVRFFVGNKRISTCKERTTSGTYPNNTATCTWKPAVTGRQFLTATLTPTDNTFSSSTSARTEVFVQKRTTTR